MPKLRALSVLKRAQNFSAMGMVFRTFLKSLYHIFYYGLSYKLCTNCVNPINLLGFMTLYDVS